MVLAVMGCCGNLGGAVVPIGTRIDVGSTTGGVGIAVGCASIPSVESGTTGFGTGGPASGGCAAFSVFSSLWGAIGMSGLGTEVPGGLVTDSGQVEPTKGSLMAGVACWMSVGLSESDPSDESCRS